MATNWKALASGYPTDARYPEGSVYRDLYRKLADAQVTPAADDTKASDARADALRNGSSPSGDCGDYEPGVSTYRIVRSGNDAAILSLKLI